MPNLFVVIGWYLFIAFVIWAMQRMTRCFTQLNIFTLFMAFLLMRHGITVPFDDRINPDRWFIPLYEYTLPRFYISLVLMYCMLLIGVYVGRRLFGSGVVDEQKFQAEMQPRHLPHGINPPVFLAVVGVAVAVVVMQNWSASINLMNLLTGNVDAAAYREARDAFGLATNSAGGPLNRLAGIARLGLFPMLIGTLFFLMSYGKLWQGLFLLVVGVGVVIGVGSGQKGPAVYLLLGIAVAFYLRQGRLKLYLKDWRIWLLVAVGVFVILPFLYYLQYPTMPYLDRMNLTLYRLSSEPNRGLQLYFQVYPEIQNFLWGGSSGLLNTVFGREIPAELIPERFIPILYLGASYLNTWNTAFIGAAWTDFGYPGVIVESFLVGMLLQGYASWFARAQKTALVMGTQVGLIMAVIRLSEVSLTAGLLTYGVLSTFLLYLLVRNYSVYRPEAPVEPVASPTSQNMAIDP